jgi:protein disulfide-isomerase
MRITLLLALFISLGTALVAQNSATVVPGTEPSNPGWYTNMNDAYKQAQKLNKPILVNFTGSDWCGWCKKLTASVFSQSDFKSWADKNVVLLELDYPRGKELPPHLKTQNENIRAAVGVMGYPSVYLMDLKLNAAAKTYEVVTYGKTGYKSTVGEFTGEVDKMIATKASTIK